MSPDQRDILLLRYLDGNASAEEVAALNALLTTDAEARATLSAITMQALAMGDLARERAFAAPPPRIHPAPVRRWLRPVLGLAAMLLLAMGLTAWLLSPGGERVTLAQVNGAVSWSADSQPPRSGLGVGAELGAGTLSIEGAASSAQLRFRDGTTLTLAGETELSFAAARQKRLTLRRGSLMAEVRPQPAGRPMLVRTATAEARVLGTRFSLAVQDNQTALAVESGRVQLTRLADNTRIELAPGQASIATLETTAPLATRRLPPAPPNFRQAFDQPPPAIWQGQWLPPDGQNPARLRNVSDVSERRPDGTPIAAYVVAVRDNSGGIASVGPESTLRIRWRIAPGHDVLALVGLHQPTGWFAGNFQTVIHPDAGQRDADGWRTIRLPLASLEPQTPECPRVPPAARVFLIYIACYWPAADLEVAEVAIE